MRNGSFALFASKANLRVFVEIWLSAVRNQKLI